MTNDDSRPALLGGSPARPGGPPDWPQPDADVRRALEVAYENGSWGKYHGENVERLQHELARYCGVPHAWTCCSGTFAVELALRALQVGADDEVVLAAYDYGGNFRSVLAVGAKPVLVDVNSDNWNMAVEHIDTAIGPRTRAIIVSHLHGGIVPISQVIDIARRRGVSVVEDAAQATGAMIEGRRAGTWGDVGTLSFGGSKLLTAGRGGALLTAGGDIHQRARLICERGNDVFPLSELQAAVLLPQLARLDERNRTRAERVQKLFDLLHGVAGLRPLRNAPMPAEPAFYKVGFQFDATAWGNLSRDRFIEALRAEGVACDAGFRALHVGRSSSRYRRAGVLSQAERAHHGMVVLHHPVLLGSVAEIVQVARAIEKTAAFRQQL
jgi:dTDP-4-amino-4,6-dideoxygalactose transaminase